MRSPLISILCLVAVASATIRHAEAARRPDGSGAEDGRGHGSEVAILKARLAGGPHSASNAPPTPRGPILAFHAAPGPSARDARIRAARTAGLPVLAARRHAWLQRYRC